MLDRHVGMMTAADDVGLALSDVLGGAVSAPRGRVVLCIIAGPSPALLMVVWRQRLGLGLLARRRLLTLAVLPLIAWEPVGAS